jgi:hypothetical protein
MRILTIGFSLEVMMWPANKLFGEKQVELHEYKREYAQLCAAEKHALASEKIFHQDRSKKGPEIPENEKITVRVADQHGDGLVNMLAGNSMLGHGLSFVMRLVGKLTDHGSLKVAISAPRDILEAGAKSKLESIRARKYFVKCQIEHLEREIDPDKFPRVSVPEDLADSGKKGSRGPFPER